MSQQGAKRDAAGGKSPRSRLGRGLSSLMQLDEASSEDAALSPATADGDAGAGGKLLHVEPDKIVPNPYQPRRTFGPVALAELATSLKTSGVIQPLVVRDLGDGTYELIAGERRLRAAQLAGLERVPVVVRHVERGEQAELALVENIHREDLNPVERAEAYRDLQRHLGVNQSELAERLGEERASVNNHLRLLDLPANVLDHVRSGRLPLGHAKVLAGVGDAERQRRLADRVVSEGLSVRQLERLAGDNASREEEQGAAASRVKSEHLDKFAATLTKAIGTRCGVVASGQGYKVTITLKNAEHFDRLMQRLGVGGE